MPVRELGREVEELLARTAQGALKTGHGLVKCGVVTASPPNPKKWWVTAK